MNSLERSLQLGLVASLVLLMFIFWWAATLSSRLLSESFVYTRLQADARSLQRSVQIPGEDLQSISLGTLRLSQQYELPASGRYFYVLADGATAIVSRSAWDQPLDLAPLAAGQELRQSHQGRAGEPLLLWQAGYSRNGQEFTLVMAEDITPIVDRLRLFQWFFAFVSTLLLLALVTVQHFIVKSSVQKLDAIRQDINRLERGKVAALSEDVPAEIMPLVREFNRLLLRFDQRLRQSRNAVGNLAHSLKGPMNLLLRSAAVGDDTARQNAERISTLIDGELKRARLAGRGTAGQRIDLNTELPPLIGLLQQVYSDKQVDIRFSIGPQVQLLHDRQDMLELIGNLLDNAVKWASGVVMLSVRSAEGVLLEVEDDGPGCSPELLHQLTQRGVRVDESIAGHGLGLSIVKDIVDSYDGQLELGRSGRLGGMRASVRLPDVVEY